MAPYDQNSLAAILAGQGQNLSQIPGMGDVGADHMGTLGALVGQPAGTGQVNLRPSPIASVPYEMQNKMPGVSAPSASEYGLGAAKASGANPSLSGAEAGIGMEAMKMIAALDGGKKAPPPPGASVAPRGNQIDLKTTDHSGQLDPRGNASMAKMLFGG